MRQLSALELEFVVGGWSDSGGTTTVTVHGSPPPIDPWPFVDPGTGGGDSGDNGGGGGAPDPSCDCPVPHNAPAGVDTKTLRDDIRSLANQMSHMDPNIEHAAAVMRMADGTLVVSQIADGDGDSFRLNLGTFQPGEQIVAIIHTHPATPGVDERTPSNDDNAAVGNVGDTTIQQNLINSGTMDPNGLVYIVDDASGHTYEYQATDKSGNLGYDVTDPSSDSELPGNCTC